MTKSNVTKSNLAECTASELSRLLADRACSSLEIVGSLLSVIDRLEPSVQAFVDIDPEGALAQARERDKQPSRGPLHGIPIAVKDTVDVAGLHCIWGTQIHKDRVPREDAKVVTQLRQAGAIVVGTTVTAEYAIAHAGPTRNPHDIAHMPGGSSSGSGAAVAARMVPLAVATQSVGSIIRPSSFCGVFGLKASKGAISTVGCMPLSPFLDHAGPMARSVEDIVLACAAMFDRDAGVPVPLLAPLPRGTRVIRVEGPLRERIEPPSFAALDRAEQALVDAGCVVERADLPQRFDRLTSCFETIIQHDMAARHGGDRDRHGDQMSERFRAVIDNGRAIGPDALAAAMDDAAYFREIVTDLLRGDAIILTPATDGSAPVYSEGTGNQKLQALWTIVGVPSIAVPCGLVDGLPVSVQLVAAHGHDSLALAAAREVERRHPIPAPAWAMKTLADKR